MSNVRRLETPVRAGPYLKDLVNEMRTARRHVDFILAVLTAVIDPDLEQQLGAANADVLCNRLACAVVDLDAAIDTIEDGALT